MNESQDKKQKLLAARDLLIRAGRLDSTKEGAPVPLPLFIEQSGGPAEGMLLRISEVMSTGCRKTVAASATTGWVGISVCLTIWY